MKGLIRNISTVLGISLIAKLTVFATEIVIAAYLGTTYKADAFSMISGIQQVIYPMLGIGIWKVFLPEYQKNLLENGDTAADELANKMLTIMIILSFAVSLGIFVTAKTLVSLIAPGFNEEAKALTTTLVKIASPQYIFVVVAALFSAMLQARNKFFASQIREVASYIPLIICASLLYHIFDVYVLAFGVLLGSIFRFIIQLPFINWGYRYSFSFNIRDKKILRLLKKMPSVLITASMTQLNSLVDKIIASKLLIGAVAGLSYGQRLLNVFSGLITSAISIALYPTISQLAIKDEKEKLSNLVISTIKIISALIVPITILCLVYNKEIVILAYKRGVFDSNSVKLTSAAFSAYSIGMIFVGLKDIFSNVFYSFGNTKVTLEVSLVTIMLNIVLSIILSRVLGIFGIAIASSIAAIYATSALFVKMKKYINVSLNSFGSEILTVVFSSLLFCYVVEMGLRIFHIQEPIFRLIILLLIGIPMYILLLNIFKAEIIRKGKKYIKELIKRN